MHTHQILQLLYAQKFVNRVLPRIIAGAKDASSEWISVKEAFSFNSLSVHRTSEPDSVIGGFDFIN
jgi:hypothetical protein